MELPPIYVAGQQLLDAKIASAVKRRKVSLEEPKAQEEDRLLRGTQSAYMINDYFRLAGAHDTVLDYADLFSITSS